MKIVSLAVIINCLCCVQQAIMKDKWMNVGFEDDELKPFIEPDSNMNDAVRIGKLLAY